jgi:septum formation protein
VKTAQNRLTIMLESMDMAPVLLLASNSPRRRQLLGLTGWDFEVGPVDIDESPRPGEDPADYVLRLAEHKAQAAKPFAKPGQLVLAADTTVADGKVILGKPENPADARRMLAALRGRDHRVFTALAVLDPATGRMQTDLSDTKVWMRQYSDSEVEAYLDSGDPFDKAGAYAIQHAGFHPVERIEGCFAGVVGLPLCRVVAALRDFGLSPSQDVTGDCQTGLNSNCAVARILQNEEAGASGGRGQGKEK